MNNTNKLGNNQSIRDAIQKIALHSVVNGNGVVYDTQRISGFVAKIHTDGDLAGTIDVQEYSSVEWGDSGARTGYHEGVRLSAIQNNLESMVIIPKLYSEVVMVTDPETKVKYVSMYSHVDIIQLDSHETVTVGVSEREEFDDSDPDSPDIDELEKTGNASKTTYTKDAIVSEVMVEEEVKSSQTINPDKIALIHGDSEITAGEESSTIKFGGSLVEVQDTKVYVGGKDSTDDAVLGGELATILMDMLDYISQIKTITQLGPQPPMNMAQFVALKSKINSFKNSHSGFLTEKVQIRK